MRVISEPKRYTVTINKSQVKVGDSIICRDGFERTVCRNNIKTGFCGRTIFGDSYDLGTVPVTKVIYQPARIEP